MEKTGVKNIYLSFSAKKMQLCPKYILFSQCETRNILCVYHMITILIIDLPKSILLAPAKMSASWKIVLSGPHG